jgi:hypothetical protein
MRQKMKKARKKMIRMIKPRFGLFIVFSLLMAISCEKEDDERQIDSNYNPVIKPENFTDSITNVYFPLRPGTVYTYLSPTEDGLETIVVTVLTETKMVAGVKCTIVRDIVSLDDEVIEDTYDWYAQDTDGNVWYMGEDVSNYENGVLVDHDGSFEAGIDGARPGIIMLAGPVMEMPYRQEYYFNQAEDWAKVIAMNVTVITSYAIFENCIKTEDWNGLKPDAPVEYKYYAPNVGVVMEEIEGRSEYVDLISIESNP